MFVCMYIMQQTSEQIDRDLVGFGELHTNIDHVHSNGILTFISKS